MIYNWPWNYIKLINMKKNQQNNLLHDIITWYEF